MPERTDHDLLQRIEAAPWHSSEGFTSHDGSHVGTHQYLLARDGPEVKRLIEDLQQRILADDAWVGRYKPGGYPYRYLTLSDGWTYWRMGSPWIINRDHVNRQERESMPARAAPRRGRA